MLTIFSAEYPTRRSEWKKFINKIFGKDLSNDPIVTLNDGKGTTANGSAIDLGGNILSEAILNIKSLSGGIKIKTDLTVLGMSNSSTLNLSKTEIDLNCFTSGSMNYSNLLLNPNRTFLYYSNNAGTESSIELLGSSIKVKGVKSGATQAAAGASVNELWKTASHGSLPNGVLMIGI